MLSLSIYCADTLEEAGKMAGPMIVMMHRMRQGDLNSPMVSEDDAVAMLGGISTQPVLRDARIPPRYLIGTPETIKKDLLQIAAAFETDEIIVQCIGNHLENRLKCFALLAEAFDLKP